MSIKPAPGYTVAKFGSLPSMQRWEFLAPGGESWEGNYRRRRDAAEATWQDLAEKEQS
jgi:hypothetical protein